MLPCWGVTFRVETSGLSLGRSGPGIYLQPYPSFPGALRPSLTSIPQFTLPPVRGSEARSHSWGSCLATFPLWPGFSAGGSAPWGVPLSAITWDLKELAQVLLLTCSSSVGPAQLPWSLGLLKFKEMQGGVRGRPRKQVFHRCRQQADDELFMSLQYELPFASPGSTGQAA